VFGRCVGLKGGFKESLMWSRREGVKIKERGGLLTDMSVIAARWVNG
jgi:hypothetical protein